ncbi:MAG: putative aldo/keto reductase [Eubacterium sp.]|jgi:aryl-alcohol dehydrogenase-like predicted oxidoreductase|nr:putative aldo/keto reductase [Eubacterium sp.]
MKYFEIKDANGMPIRMSRIILGGVPFGTTLDNKQSFEMMDRYLEAKGNTIDTARVYCDWLENGHSASERTIGEWIRARNNRKEVILVTKGGHPGKDGVTRLSANEIISDMETSLKTLQTDYADLYLLHRDDANIPVDGIMDTLHTLVLQGKARAVGVSNWSCERIKQANEYAEKNNKTKLVISQIQWSLAECFPKNFNDETLVCMNDREYEQYLEMGMPVMAFSSQANGLFSKADDKGLVNVSEKLQKFLTLENINRYNNLTKLCQKKGYSKTAVALNYIMDNKLNGSAIIGCTNIAQLQNCLEAADITLTEEEIQCLI